MNDEELLIIAHIEHEMLQGFHLQINQQGPRKGVIKKKKVEVNRLLVKKKNTTEEIFKNSLLQIEPQVHQVLIQIPSLTFLIQI